MEPIRPSKIDPHQVSKAHAPKAKTKAKKEARVERTQASRSARLRKMRAESPHKHLASAPVSVDKIETDLENLNAGKKGALTQLIKDIGGISHLSSYRTPDGYSLVDLCGILTADPKKPSVALTNAIQQLLDHGFEFKSVGPDGEVLNDLPPRYQWEMNNGYCGETSFITAGLDNGEYISEAEARELGTGSQSEEVKIGDGSGDSSAFALAQAMHLQYSEWDTQSGNTAGFLAWAKQQVDAGHPVIMGVYMNENTFYNNPDPNAGESSYDHIVTITGISNGNITFCDNGLYGNSPTDSPYTFTYPIAAFEGNRQQANTQFDQPDPSIPRNLYTLPDDPENNFGGSVGGVNGSDETMPCHLLVSPNNEPIPPATCKMTVTACMTNLVPGKTYHIYIYNSLSNVPDSNFNQNSGQAAQCITFTATGSNYVYSLPNQINSSDQIAFRVVPSDGP